MCVMNSLGDAILRGSPSHLTMLFTSTLVQTSPQLLSMPDQTVHNHITDILGGYGARPTVYVLYGKGSRLNQPIPKSTSMLSQVGYLLALVKLVNLMGC